MQFWRPRDPERPDESESPRRDRGRGGQRAFSRNQQLELLHALETHRNVIIQGQAQSNMHTEVPRYLLEAGWADSGKCVAVCVRRQVSAITAAARIVEEEGLDESHIGSTYVGFAVDSSEKRSTSTKLVYFTDHAILHSLLREPLLLSVSILIVTDFHERGIFVDLLLGLLKKIQNARSDLRVIVTTAYLDGDYVSRFLGASESTTLNLPNMFHPVTIFHSQNPVEDYLTAALEVVKDSYTEWERSDKPRNQNVLVFVKSTEEAELLCENVNDWYSNKLQGKESDMKRRLKPTKLLSGYSKLLAVPLFASLEPRRQLSALRTDADYSRPKVIVATNIAETSLTVCGVSRVIDCGVESIDCFDAQTGTTFVSTVPISKASAQRRATRAGVGCPGICMRLYTRKFMTDRMPESRPPEILRSDLTEIVMILMAIGVSDVRSFVLMDLPKEEHLTDAIERLFHLGVITDQGELTNPIGMRMSTSTLNARMAKCLFVGESYGVGRMVAAIASMLAVKHVIFHRRKGIEKSRSLFAVAEGDLITFLNIFRRYIGNGQSDSWCAEHNVNAGAMKRAVRLFSQTVRANLLPVSQERSFAAGRKALGLTPAECVCRSITAGYFENAAAVEPDGSYLVAVSGRRVRLSPSSVLRGRMPKWVIFLGLTERHDMYEMKDVTVIRPEWVVEYAPRLFEYLHGARDAER